MSDEVYCLDIIKHELILGSLAEIIYNYYDNLEKLLPKLNVRCFYLMKPWTHCKSYTPLVL